MRGAETFFGVRALHPRAVRLPCRPLGTAPEPHSVEPQFLKTLDSIHLPPRSCQSLAACARTQKAGGWRLVYAICASSGKLLILSSRPRCSEVDNWLGSFLFRQWRQQARASLRLRNRQTEERATPGGAEMVHNFASINGRPVEDPVGVLN